VTTVDDVTVATKDADYVGHRVSAEGNLQASTFARPGIECQCATRCVDVFLDDGGDEAGRIEPPVTSSGTCRAGKRARCRPEHEGHAWNERANP
jgi:hypothetical protein